MEFFNIMISIAATLASTFVPSIVVSCIKISRLNKAKANAQTDAEMHKAENAIKDEARKLVAGAEVGLANIDKLLKTANCGTAGALKKHDAKRDLKVFCLENGIPWDDEKMDEVIEKEIEFSKTVNAK